MPYDVLDPSGAVAAPISTIGDPLSGVGLTLAQMRNELMMQLGEREDVNPGRVDMWLNLGYIDLCSMLRLDELRASMLLPLTMARHTYMLPSCVGTTLGVSVVDTTTYITYGGRPLDKITLEEYRRRAALTGHVEAFFRLNQMLVMWPIPVIAVNAALDFMIRPSFMVDDSDSPILPIEWHEAVLLNGKVKAFNGLEEPENELAAEASFTKHLSKRLDKAQEEDRNRVPRTIVVKSRAGMYRNPHAPLE